MSSRGSKAEASARVGNTRGSLLTLGDQVAAKGFLFFANRINRGLFSKQEAI